MAILRTIDRDSTLIMRRDGSQRLSPLSFVPFGHAYRMQWHWNLLLEYLISHLVRRPVSCVQKRVVMTMNGLTQLLADLYQLADERRETMQNTAYWGLKQLG